MKQLSEKELHLERNIDLFREAGITSFVPRPLTADVFRSQLNSIVDTARANVGSGQWEGWTTKTEAFSWPNRVYTPWFGLTAITYGTQRAIVESRLHVAFPTHSHPANIIHVDRRRLNDPNDQQIYGGYEVVWYRYGDEDMSGAIADAEGNRYRACETDEDPTYWNTLTGIVSQAHMLFCSMVSEPTVAKEAPLDLVST